MTDLAIQARNCEILRGGNAVVPGLTLDIPKGALFGLAGPSGSGKTTIMRAMLGLGAIHSGEMRILGHTAGDAALRSLIGYQPQEGGIWLDLTARESLMFIADIYRTPHHRIDEVFALLELEPVADRITARLSGGEQRRVGLAMAILHRPQLLILDEPTVGLDPRLRHKLWKEFHAWAEAGTTLVVSTHVMDEAAECDAVAIVMDGRVIADDSPQELISQTQADSLEHAMLVLFEREEAKHVH